MLTVISNNDLVKIREEDVDVIRVMAHPVRLKIISELMHYKNVQCYTVNRNIKTSTIHYFTTFSKVKRNCNPCRKKRIRDALIILIIIKLVRL